VPVNLPQASVAYEMPANNEASLLGLPVEIWLRIYGYVCQHTLHIRWSHRRIAMRKGFLAKEQVPWLSLMFCCSTITRELRDYMHSAAYLGQEHNRTWVFDFRWPRYMRVSLAWRKMPCRPQDAKSLLVNLEGKPTIATSTINLIVRYGPRVNFLKPFGVRFTALTELMVKPVRQSR